MRRKYLFPAQIPAPFPRIDVSDMEECSVSETLHCRRAECGSHECLAAGSSQTAQPAYFPLNRVVERLKSEVMNETSNTESPVSAEELLSVVYAELHRLAEAHFRGQRSDHTLQPTALVHEAYLKVARGKTKWKDQQHFFALAATAMRQILITHARSKRAAKRNAQRVDITLTAMIGRDDRIVDLVALDTALMELEQHNKTLARLVELRYFAGLSTDEIATELSMSRRKVQVDLRYVRAWLAHRLGIETHDE